MRANKNNRSKPPPNQELALRDLLSAIASVADEVWALCDAIATVDDLRVTRNLIAVVGQKAAELVGLVRRK
jgi:hypothetical protein